MRDRTASTPRPSAPGRSLRRRLAKAIDRIVEGVLDGIAGLAQPAPVPVPVRVRPDRRRR
ncbi:hypothetical protein [Rhodocista pekingensis]|uniref:Uncharacterized protein n=1 Tax=Rhodocista pekingensis TaxID=201185 RepID=A0ABW2KXZ5_9PROT